MAPSPQQLPRLQIKRTKSFLTWAFALSLVVHAALGPIVGRYKPSHAEERDPQIVSLTARVHVSLPTPPPPTPSPRPLQTKAPAKHAFTPRHAFRANVVHTTSRSDAGPAEAAYTSGPGDVAGDGGRIVAPASAQPIAATPLPTPVATPKPTCVQPHVDATTTNPVVPDTPETAREQGATGTVQVKVALSATGSVLSATVYKSSGSPLLDGAALHAAQQSAYAPELDDCIKVSGEYIFRADFEGN
jgi:protein TonB